MSSDIKHSLGSFRVKLVDDGGQEEILTLRDPVPTGRQILEGSKRVPADEYVLLLLQADGMLEEVNLTETLDLRKRGAETLYVFHGDRIFYFVMDGRRFPWGTAKIAESILRRLVEKGDDSQVWQEQKGKPDLPIESGGVVNLKDDAVEHFYTTQRLDIFVSTRILENGAETFHFNIPRTASILEVMAQGAQRAGVMLLPTADEPFDQIHNINGEHVGPAITELDQAVGAYLQEHGHTKHFGIRLVLAFRVNTRWAVAPKSQMSPREILSLPGIELDYTEYTLYIPGSNEPLPLDDPIHITRGKGLEVQRDGKYGMER